MLHVSFRVLCSIIFLFVTQLSAQTDYRDDARSASAASAVKQSVELGKLCFRILKTGVVSSSAFDSVKMVQSELERSLKQFEDNSRYLGLQGLCYTLCLDQLSRVYELKGDSAVGYKLMVKQYDWILETFNEKYYPIKVNVAGNSEKFLEYTRGFLFSGVSTAMRKALMSSIHKQDWLLFSRLSKTFLDLGLNANEQERREIYVNRYLALQKLNNPLAERLAWMRTTMLYFKSTNSTSGDWKSGEWDLSIEFYQLLAEWKLTGKVNSQSDLLIAGKALYYMSHFDLADKVYQELLTESDLLSFDNANQVYDFYMGRDLKQKALQTLKRLDVAGLGCVDLSVTARRFRELGDSESAEEFEKRYRKCMRDSKKFDRWQRRQDNFDLWGWLKEGWKEKANLAVSVNPLAGLNNDMGRKGGVFKYIPMSADLRTGAFLHEFRWNRFMYYNGSERFTRGNLVEPKIENEITNEWNSLRGNDYSYYLGIVAHRTEDEGYNPRWKGYHAFGVQYLWGNFEADEEVASVLFKGNTVAQDVRIRPTIYRYEWLVQWKYSRFYTKWFYYTLFIGAGTGQRSLSYNSPDPGIGEGQLMSSTETTFYDSRLVQSNWIGRKLTFRAGFRVGITIK